MSEAATPAARVARLSERRSLRFAAHGEAPAPQAREVALALEFSIDAPSPKIGEEPFSFPTFAG